VICDEAQALLSARMDGEHVRADVAGTLEEHVAGCATCRTFEASSAKVRSSLRIRTAEEIPDLVVPIMEAVAREGAPRRFAPIARIRPPRTQRPSARALLAAALAGSLVGSLVVGGPWRGPEDGPIAAAAIVRGVRSQAPTLDTFEATYTIVERGFSPDVPLRELTMELAYLAPQRFRLEIVDGTTYPSEGWTPTDVTYIEDMPAAYRSGPTGCPADPVAGCPPTRETVTLASEYSAAAPLPADLILPLATFGSARGVRVIEETEVGGREAVVVEMSFSRAAPLFPFLRVGGAWRPFFAGDRVSVWLDASTWFPLRVSVTPVDTVERRAWEMRFGRAPETGDEPILEVTAVAFGATAPDPSTFAIPGLAPAAALTLAEAGERLDYLPLTPTSPGGLELTDVVLPDVGRAGPSSLLVYTGGLDYVRIGERPDWGGDEPFGPVDALAQRVELAGGSVAYYEPAGDGLGRRLAIHAAETDLFLESNLPRADLLELASTIPLHGLSMPREWGRASSGETVIRRVEVPRALDLAGLVGLEADLPAGYVLAGATAQGPVSDVTVLAFRLRQREVDAAGAPLTLHVEPGGVLPSASSAGSVLVRLDGIEARWTAARSQLEWLSGGAYLALQGDSDLRTLAAIALAVSER
jgi:hypothetical protein